MQRHRSIPLALPFAIAFVMLSSKSGATEKSTDRPSAAPMSSQGDYGYRFTDDPLQAGAFTPADPRIVVATHVNRAALLRPRMAFVAELLKSVENL